MLALASALGTHAIIFPEGAAITIGVWSLALPGWAVSRWRVATLPALAIALIPLLLRAPEPVDHTLAIAAGAASTYLGALAAHRIALRA